MDSINIALILHDIRSTYNVGSIFRSAECFGMNKIYISGYTPYPDFQEDTRLPHIAQKLHDQIAKTALGAEQLVPFTVCVDIEEAIANAREDGFAIMSIEQAGTSVPIESYVFRTSCAFILGNEVIGISEWTKAQSAVILEIKQYGKKESLNVASAAVVALYAARTQTHAT